MLFAPLAMAVVCAAGGLTPHKAVRGTGTSGDANVVTDGILAVEGAFWSGPNSVILREANADLVIDLGAEQPIAAFFLQADNDDQYVVEGSTDGTSYSTLWVAPANSDGPGLRSRQQVLTSSTSARYLRITGKEGDGRFAVSELVAYCAAPTVWPTRITAPIHIGWSSINEATMAIVRLVLAVAGVALLLAGIWLGKRKQRLRDAILVFLGATSFACFFNFGHFHFDRFIHIWEMYHYYIGAKYSPELGYSRIYQCTAVAETELEYGKQVADRKMRDLTTNHLETTELILANPRQCTDHFTSDRWNAFKGDIRFFRNQFPATFWRDSQQDHGYNGTPVWGITGRLLSSSGPATAKQIFALALLDPLLLILMWAGVWWAFGWRTMCVALIFWGTNHPARYYWNGGAFLRMDWLAMAVLGVCFLKREKHVGAGFLLTFSALLRIFPGFICVALVLKIIADMVRQRRWRLSPQHLRLALGATLALVTLLPLSVIAARGVGTWPSFVENSKKHLQTPLTNNVGLRTVLAYEWSTRAIFARNYAAPDPFQYWKADRLAAEHRTRFQFWALVAAFLAFYIRAVRGQPDWIAAALGVALIPVAAELTCYYDSVLLLFALLWFRDQLMGVVALGFAATTCILARVIFWEDDIGFAITLATLATVAVLTWLVGRQKTAPPT